MNGVTLNISTDAAATEFPSDDFEINALIRCAPWFTVATLPLDIVIIIFLQFDLSYEINISICKTTQIHAACLAGHHGPCKGQACSKDQRVVWPMDHPSVARSTCAHDQYCIVFAGLSCAAEVELEAKKSILIVLITSLPTPLRPAWRPKDTELLTQLHNQSNCSNSFCHYASFHLHIFFVFFWNC